MRKKKVKEKQCTRCGEMKPLSEFYTYKYKGRKYTRGFCRACDLRRRRERYREKHPGGLTYDKDTGKLWLRKGRGKSLVWTSQMLSDLRRLFPTTKNEELAGILGVGVRTVVRKAREMGLEKDKEWLRTLWKENIRMGHMMSRALGYPGSIKKGEHRNPEGEFKRGRVADEDWRKKLSDGNKRNWMLHRNERLRKIMETRRRNGTSADIS